MKLGVMAAKENLQVGITEVLAHGEPLQLSGGVKWFSAQVLVHTPLPSCIV